MMDAPDDAAYLWITTDEAEGPGAPLRVSGELDAGSVPELLAAIDVRIAEGREVVLDLAGISFLDSSGIRAIAETLRRSGAEGFGLRISAASETVERLLEMTGMAALIDR